MHASPDIALADISSAFEAGSDQTEIRCALRYPLLDKAGGHIY